VPIHPKLVRDRIPELINRNGGEAHTRRLSDEEFATALARKLVEEAEEFAATPTAEELADVLEVVRALATAAGSSLDEVEAVRRAKAAERGAFDERLLLESVAYADQPDEEPTEIGAKPHAARLYEDLLQRAQADDNVVGLILAGSRGPGIFATDRSDFDTYLILRSPDDDWRAGHGSPVEVWPMTLDDFRRHALVGDPDDWNRPTFLYARVEIDKLDGEVRQLVEQKSRLMPDEVGGIVPKALDGYINSLYRSLKNQVAGRELEGRLDALESLPPLLTTAFALEGRVRPFNKYLRHELEQRALPTVGLDAIGRIAREPTPDAQRAIFRDIESRARDAGFGSVVDGWDPDVSWLRGDGSSTS